MSAPTGGSSKADKEKKGSVKDAEDAALDSDSFNEEDYFKNDENHFT